MITSDRHRKSLRQRAVPISDNRAAFPAERRAGPVLFRSYTREVARGERAVRVIVPIVSKDIDNITIFATPGITDVGKQELRLDRYFRHAANRLVIVDYRW